jgi:hypothetical protein
VAAVPIASRTRIKKKSRFTAKSMMSDEDDFKLTGYVNKQHILGGKIILIP